MADDSLDRLHAAALDCNEAAKNTLEWLKWRDGGIPLHPDALPFPLGQTAGTTDWHAELERCIWEWWDASRVDACLERITDAAVSLRLPAVQIGIVSCATGHEAAFRRAKAILSFFDGSAHPLPEGIDRDFRGRIEQEYVEAGRSRSGGGNQAKMHPWGNDDPDIPLTPAKIADRLGIPAKDKRKRDTLRKRLEKWRRQNPKGGWIEDEQGGGRKVKYSYPIGKAWPVVEDMKHSD